MHEPESEATGSPRAVVAGGGVAGMSAAHELSRRGFDVVVCEAHAVAGGKARSIPVPGTGSGGRPDLPGEHGFRTFPRFYRHLDDTMRTTPAAGGSAYDHLVDTTRLLVAGAGVAPVAMPDRLPHGVGGIVAWLGELLGPELFGSLEAGEAEYFADRMWQLLTSCPERAMADYEHQSWWDYVGAADRSAAYQRLLGVGLTRSLVAARPTLSNAKVTGDIFLQLVHGMITPGRSTDLVLDGPTSEVWLEPWLDHLRGAGVDYRTGHRLVEVAVEDGTVAGFTFELDDGSRVVESGDVYMLCLPVEVVARLLQDPAQQPVLDADPSLTSIVELGTATAWMNGIQFYLRDDVALAPGHVLLLDSPWAITAISQQQFWRSPLRDRGDGTVAGCISLDISDWQKPGRTVGATAESATRRQIFDEVFAELRDAVGPLGVDLTPENLHSWFLDPDIADVDPGDRSTRVDAEPLYIAEASSWGLRPDATTAVPNLFLASDYVRTHTQLPTMEGANEAARRAVNGALAATGSTAEPCPIWPLHVPWYARLMRWFDHRRFVRGRPYHSEFPAVISAAARTLHTVERFWRHVEPGGGSPRRRLSVPKPLRRRR